MKRVLITGAGGFVGARLARHLLAHRPTLQGGGPVSDALIARPQIHQPP